MVLESHCQGKVSFHWAVGREREEPFQELCTGHVEEEGLKPQSSTWGRLPLVRLPLKPSKSAVKGVIHGGPVAQHGGAA